MLRSLKFQIFAFEILGPFVQLDEHVHLRTENGWNDGFKDVINRTIAIPLDHIRIVFVVACQKDDGHIPRFLRAR